MPIYIILGIIAIFLAFFLGLALKGSAKFDRVVKDITEEIDITPKPTEGVIKDISAAEQALKAKAKLQQDEAKRLQKESAKIGDYLTGRGVVKPKQGKEADNK